MASSTGGRAWTRWAAVEVTASHFGLAFDPRVVAHVLAALERHQEEGAVELDSNAAG